MARHLLVTNDYPPKTGGIQVYLHELWQRLEPGRGVVLTALSHPDAARFDAATEVIVERIAAATLFLPTPRAFAAIEAAIERHQPDLVLLDPAWPLGLLGPWLSRPYGVVLHGAEVTIPGRIPLVASSLRYVLAHAEVAICAGSYPEAEARRNAADRMPPVIQIPPGVDTARFVPQTPEQRAALRSSLGIDDDAFLVSSYSRLVPRKGMDTLIRASARLGTRRSDLRVVIGGAGRDRARLEKLATRLKAPVTFLGRIPDEQLVPLLGSSDLMVMDCRSRWLGLEQEGFGIVFVEAGACGVAQVAGRSGGSHEAVIDGESGTVVANSRSVRALESAMADLMDDPERRSAYAQRSRDLAVERFEWDRLAQRLSRELTAFDHFRVSEPSL
ncbi:MAG TPA: glycosyltransferase family 4 protein [Acidimicrobiales bacterium]|nr:glycosyltransferase family 4 protein [Acidimicrobiales bacterium]